MNKEKVHKSIDYTNRLKFKEEEKERMIDRKFVSAVLLTLSEAQRERRKNVKENRAEQIGVHRE